MSQWIPLMDYAMKKGVSLSTLRRHIKSNKIPYRLENGRYLLPDNMADHVAGNMADNLSNQLSESRVNQQESTPEALEALPSDPAQVVARNTINYLTLELKKAQEEIAELKMLIALYEDSMPKQRVDA